MTQLEQALQPLNQRRNALETLKVVERYRPVEGRIGHDRHFHRP